MKIALVNPHPSSYPPLGLATIASYLMERGHEVSIHEGLNPNLGKPDLIGIGALTLWLDDVKQLIERLPMGVPKVLGGPCTIVQPNLASEVGVDSVVIGEGEKQLVKLIQDFAEGNMNQRYRTDKFLDMHEKLVPAWSLLPRLDYEAGLGVETSRGCPFNCVFCTAPFISGRKWRARTPEEVLVEVSFVAKKYKPKRIYFADDNCTVSPERWTRICRLLAEKNLGVELQVPEGIQAHHLDYETLWLMRQAGFRKITVGAESGSQRVLDEVIDKGGLTLEQVERVVKWCVKLKLKVSCFFVVGIPGEMLSEVYDTLHFAEKLRRMGAESCSVRNCLPVPGSRLWSLAKERGELLITEEEAGDHKLLHSGRHFFKTDRWTPRQIEELAKRGYKENVKHQRRKHPWRTAKRALKKFVGW